ncbi:MAG TPA: PxKF domain-containing protein [Actinomycetota bacterium]|nr:PxKF domain-containing protein [Actinomycetota bacterium]
MRGSARMHIATLVTTLAVVLAGTSWAGAAAGDITEWPTVPGGTPTGIAVGADGALWFAERGADRVGRISTAGALNEIPLPQDGGGGPTGIALGPDAAMWFTERITDSIGRIDTNGAITEYGGLTSGAMPTGIALGPDAAMWFTEYGANRIGRIAPDGSVTEYPIPSANSQPTDIALGPDDAMWFTETRVSKIGRIDTGTGSVVEYPLPGGTLPSGIVAGPDGNLWFTAPGTNSVGSITPSSGVVSMLQIPTPSSDPVGIAVGPDRAVWFAERAAGKVARIGSDGTIAEYAAPTELSGPHDLTAGPDGNLWFTQSSVSAIARLELAGPDTEGPTVDIGRPAHGGAYLVGQTIHASYTCADTGGSGIVSCSGTVQDGDPIDTSAPGVRHFQVTATDGAGNATTAVHDYVVFTSWDGRLLLPPDVATLRAGQPADLSFDIGGDLGVILAPGAPYAEPVDCGSGASAAAVVTTAESVGPDFRVVNGEYRFRWRTERSWAGACYALVLPFTIDGGATVRLLARFV